MSKDSKAIGVWYRRFKCCYSLEEIAWFYWWKAKPPNEHRNGCRRGLV